MIHLSCLLLTLQFCSLFICFFHFHFTLFFVFIFYSLQLRSSLVNVVLTFNDSLILLVPSSPISLPVHLFISFHFILFFHFYSYSSPSRYSSVNVVLAFNDSLILLAPSAPIPISVCLFFLFHSPFSFPFSFFLITAQIQICPRCNRYHSFHLLPFILCH